MSAEISELVSRNQILETALEDSALTISRLKTDHTNQACQLAESHTACNQLQSKIESLQSEILAQEENQMRSNQGNKFHNVLFKITELKILLSLMKPLFTRLVFEEVREKMLKIETSEQKWQESFQKEWAEKERLLNEVEMERASQKNELREVLARVVAAERNLDSEKRRNTEVINELAHANAVRETELEQRNKQLEESNKELVEARRQDKEHFQLDLADLESTKAAIETEFASLQSQVAITLTPKHKFH